jgi:antitoxin ParD1/3/4
MQMTSMNISIPDGLREFVEAQMREPGYNSASEYVRELIRDARARVTQETELKELSKLGLEQLRQGDSLELDDTSLATFFQEAKSRARKRLAQRRALRG